MLPFADVIARLRPAYAPMLLDGRLSPKGRLIEIEVRHPDGRFFGRDRISRKVLRTERNVDNVIRGHRRQMSGSGLVLDDWRDPALIGDPMEA